MTSHACRWCDGCKWGSIPFCKACAGQRHISPLRLGLSAPGSSDDNAEWVGMCRTRVGRQVQEEGTSVSFPQCCPLSMPAYTLVSPDGSGMSHHQHEPFVGPMPTCLAALPTCPNPQHAVEGHLEFKAILFIPKQYVLFRIPTDARLITMPVCYLTSSSLRRSVTTSSFMSIMSSLWMTARTSYPRSHPTRPAHRTSPITSHTFCPHSPCCRMSGAAPGLRSHSQDTTTPPISKVCPLSCM